MGVDVSLFAKNKKVRFNADRDRVLWQTQYHDGECCEEEDFVSLDTQEIYDLGQRFRDISQGLTQKEALLFLEANLEAVRERAIVLKQPELLDYEAWWLDAMIQFVKLTGEDIYFALVDNSDEFYQLYDKYKEVFDV